MENYEYNKTFPFEDKKDDDLDSEELEKIENFLLEYQKELKKRPQFILPAAPAIFEKTVAAWERVAKEFSGRIRAKIDYSHFTATIEVWCCYVEFEFGEFMDILNDISHAALSIHFTPLTSGELHIKILMPYFIPSLE